MPPTLTSKPTEAFLGGSKRFKCQVIGNPRPIIRWFKDGVDITNNPRYNFDYTMEGRISMVIPNVTYKDEGCYRCRAENSEGIASTASFLMVRGSVHEQRDEIPTSDVAEMEIEEVYIKKREESEEFSETSKPRTEKKDRWKVSEVEMTEEVTSSSFQELVQFESSQSESLTLDRKSWQMESESETVVKSESESGFVFEGQSMVIESQVFGKNQELLAELDSDASARIKPIFVDNRKRPSDELEAEDVIELVVQEDNEKFDNSFESEVTTEKEVSLFIDESSFETTETNESQSVVASIESQESAVDSRSMERSGEVTVESDISQVTLGTQKSEDKVEISTEETSKKQTVETKEKLQKSEKTEEKTTEKKSIVEKSLISKMKQFRELRETEESEELFIKEDKESETESTDKEALVKVKVEEKKLTSAQKRELKMKEEAELRKKRREEEEAAMVERMKKFRQQREEEEDVGLFSNVVEQSSESSMVVSEETSVEAEEPLQSVEGTQVQIEEFYSKETTFEGDIELSREKREVFEFESSMSTQNFEEVTMEGECSEMIIEASVGVDASDSKIKEEQLKIHSDVAIEEIAVQEEEERLNEKNRKLSEIGFADSEKPGGDEMTISAEISTEEISKKVTDEGSLSVETEVFISEEVTSTAKSRSTEEQKVTVNIATEETSNTEQKSEKELEISMSTDVTEKQTIDNEGLKLIAEIETNEKQYKKTSADIDGVAYGEKANLESATLETTTKDIKTADQLESAKAVEVSTEFEDSAERSKADSTAISADLERGHVGEETQSEVKEDFVKTEEGAMSVIAAIDDAQKSKQKDVDGVAEGIQTRPRLTAEASVGEDDTVLEAVVDVKETQTDKGDVSNVLSGKESVGVSSGVETQAAVEDESQVSEAVSLDIPSPEKSTSAEEERETLAVSKQGQEELQSDVITGTVVSDEVSTIQTQSKTVEDFASQKDVPGVAEGIKADLEECKTGVQEAHVTTEMVDERDAAFLAEKPQEISATTDIEKASQESPEYRVDAADLTQENVASLDEESKAAAAVSEAEETERVSASEADKTESLASASEVDKELQIVEELDGTVKKESADVDGIAAGEKHQAVLSNGAETRVAESVVEMDVKEAAEISHDAEMLAESETNAMPKTKKDATETLVVEQSGEGNLADVEKLGLQGTPEKAMEIQGLVTVEEHGSDQPESKVDVQSSVDSVQYSSDLEQKASVDASVVCETSEAETGAEITITTETSVSAEPLAFSTESDVSTSEISKADEDLKIQVEIETESKPAEDETEKVEPEMKVNVEESPAKLVVSAEVDVETSKEPEQMTLSAEVDVAESEAPEKISASAEVDVSEKPLEKKSEPEMEIEVEESPAKVEVSAEVDVETSKEPEQMTLSAEVDVTESEAPEQMNVSAEIDVSEKPKDETPEVKVDADVEVKGHPADDEAEVEASEEPAFAPPDIVNGPASISVEVGQTVNIEVTISGFPAPKVSWLKGYKRVEEGKNVKLSVSGDVYTLQILNTVVADAGKYKLTATNSEGRATFDVKVDVVLPKEEPKKEEPKPVSQKSPPEIVGPADISVEIGQTLSVEVTVKGNPEPRVSWYKNDKLILPNYRTKTKVDGEVYCLQILNTVEADAGCYRATAVNQKGEASCDVKVTITLPAPPTETNTDGDVEATTEPEEMTLSDEVDVTESEAAPEELVISAEVDVSEKPKDVTAEVEAEAEVKVQQTAEAKVKVQQTADVEAEAEVKVQQEDVTAKVKVEEEAEVKVQPEDVATEAEVKVPDEPAKAEEPEKPEDVSASFTKTDEPDSKEEDVPAAADIPAVSEPEPAAPDIVSGPANISVEVGQMVNIEVTISGFPAPKVSWMKGYKRVEEGKNVKLSVSGDVYTLQILNTVMADAGKYKLTATNSEGRATFDVKVDVILPKEEPKKDEPKPVSQKPEKTPPEIAGPADISVVIGQTLSVEVTVKGNPEPRVSWYKNDKLIVPNYRTKTKVDGEVYCLQILNTVEADAGCYRATAVNQKGEASCDVKVTVTLPAPPPETSTDGDVEAITEPEEMTLSAEVDVTESEAAPKEMIISTEVDVSEKPKDVTAEVKVEAEAEVKVQQENVTAEVKVEKEPEVKTQPEEAEVKVPDEPAKGEEPEKPEDVSASFTKTDEPDSKEEDVPAAADIPAVSEPEPAAPDIVSGPASISVEVGQTVNIEVTISGFPAPKVSWLKGYKRVEEGKNVKLSVSGDVYTLQILNTVVADAGKYKLTATNSEGRATFDVKVDVVLPKEEPKKEEPKPVSQKPQKTPPEIAGPADISVVIGQTLSVEVTVKGNPEPRVSWYKNDKLVLPNYRTKTKVDGEVYCLQILNTVEADAGCYRATAVNQKGETSCDVKVTVTLPAPPPQTSTGGEDTETSVTLKDMEPPQLSTKPESQAVTEGKLVTLSATITGRPSPTVTWFKNNTLLRSGNNCKLFKQGGVHFVQISAAEIPDAGDYTICVENPAGAVFWTIQIDVEAGTDQESSTSTVGDTSASVKAEGETPDDVFLKAYIMLADHRDDGADFSLRKDETVEVLDTVNKDKWLVRREDDREKVCYVPVNLLKKKPETEDTQQKTFKRQLSRKQSEDAGSSGEEDSARAPEHFPLYIAVADYSPPGGDSASLKLSEGQFVEVLDMENTEKWLVRTKPTKTTPSKQGWVPSSYLEEKSAKGSRSTRETFREDIIKISNKQQEALVKRSEDDDGYVLTDLLETEREYINQLNSINDSFSYKMYKDRKLPEVVKEKKDAIFANLKEIGDFHSKVLLPALTACALNPGTVGKVILNLKDEFEKYIPYGSGRDNAESILSGEDVKKFLKDYNRKSGCEQNLPECLRRPIARIHEYQAVLKDILKYTCRAGEDSNDIEAAIHMLSGILRRIEDSKLLGRVEGLPGDLASLGTLIRHDDLQMWEDDPCGKGKDRHMFLFSNKLLLTKRNRDGTGFVHKTTSELQDIQINETVPADDRMYELWYAEPTSEKLTFQAKNVIARQAWAKDIREALKNLGVEETDIMPEQQRPAKAPKVPTPTKKKTKEKGFAPRLVTPGGDTTGEDYLSFESLDSDVSSYHTAPEFEDGTTRPVFKKRLRRTVVKEGDRACLECTVGGIPLPTVAWQKGVYPIRSSDELRIEVEGAWNALVIPDTIQEDSGVYTAKATNINGSAVCSAELTVGDGVGQSTDQEYITAQSALSSDGEVILPSKMGQMDSCVVEEGRMARFDCNLVADPKPEIMWLKDGKILTSSKKYEVLNPREDLHSLIVHDVNKDDSGRYVCWARNEFGEAFTEAYLNIIPTAEAEVEVERIAPKITKKFYDLVAVDGHPAELKFKFVGSPMPHIQWYIKNKEILPPREFDLKVEGDQCLFTLKEVSMEDAGKVIVKLTNPVGEDRCSAQLTVIEDLSKPRTLPKVAPKFVTRFTDVDVNQGFEARFKVKVIGEPIPTVTWLRNGVPLKDCARYKYEEYGEIFILIIENAEQGDAGEYTCQAKNKAGEASCKANLAVTKTAIPQVRKGVNGEMGPQFGYAPVFTKMIQDCDTKEGRRAEFECRAYGMPEPTATWTHNGVPLERGDRFIMAKDEDSNYHLMIKDVLPTDAGQYSCKLSNFAGKASCSAELRVEALPRRDPLRFSPERGVQDEMKVLKKAIVEPPSMPDQKPMLLDKTADTVRLSWLPAHVPSKSPSAQPVSYIIESRELPTGDWRRLSSKIPTTSYQAKALNPDVEYLFRVRAENDNGMSEPTSAAVLERRLAKDKEYRLEAPQKARKDTMGLSTEMATGPSLPSDKPSLLDIRPESVRIQWVPVTLTGPGSDYRPVKYLLEVKEIPGPWRKLASGLTGNSYFATDLNPDREYNFRVRAENKFAESEPTMPATLPKGRVVPPALPSSRPYVSEIGDESLRLSWKPADIPKALKGVSPTSYRIEVQELPRQDWQTLVSYIPDTSYRLTDLRPKQDYNFRIRAENEFGLSEPSTPFYLPRATTYPGAAVTRPDIVELEPSAVRLNWQRVEIPQFDGEDEPLTYMIEGRTPSSDWRELVRGVRGTSHRLTGLETSDDYSFRVRPDSSTRGLGDPSPPMSLSRALAHTRIPVSDVEIQELEPTSARLKWNRVHIPPFDSMEEPLLYMIECQEGPYANWRTLASGVPTTGFRVTDLKPDKDYAFRVRAETQYGISEPSPPKPLYRRPPESPRYHLEPPKIDAFDSEGLQLSWKPISPHPQIRRADPPKYTIEMREAPQADWRPVAAGIPDTSFRLSGLRPEQDYTFRVRAEMSRLPEPVALMTPSVSLLRGGVPPVLPSSAPTISNEKPNSLRLSWKPGSLPSYLTGDSGPIRYQVEMQESPSSDWRTLATRLPDLSFEVSRLHPDREYAFRVRAQTESGASAPTAPAYLYRKPIPHLPKSEPLLSDIRPDSARLTWQAVDVPGRAIDFQKVNYMIEMQEPPSETWVPFVRDVHEINHKIQNLRPDKDYVFRVRAVTDQGMSEPTMSVYLPRRAVQPRLPMAEPYISEVKPDSARLSWTPVDTPPFGAQMMPTTYRVEIQEPPNTNWQTLVRKLPTTNYLVSNLRPDKAYCLRVRAENDYGVSEPTRAVQLPRRAVAPVVPSDIPLVSDVRRGSMRLTWQPAHVPSYGATNMTLPVTYTIEAREPGQDWSPLVRRIPHTSYFLSGLKPEGDYEFRVRAESQYGLSPPGPSTALPRQQVARIPIETPEIIDIEPDGRSLTLRWRRANVPFGSGSELITYIIEAQEPPSMDWSPVARGIMDTEFRVSGLRPSQDYLFRVRAATVQGSASEPTLPVTFYRRMVSPRVPVERPQLYDLEPDAVRLSWQPTSTYQSDSPLRYTVEVREPQIKKWRPLAKSLPDTSYHVTGLKPKLDYEFRVRPETDKGLLEPTPSIPLYRKRVLPPLKFEEPVIVEDEPETVRLNWHRVTVPKMGAGDEEITYMIEAQRGPTMDWQPIARNIRDTSYRVTGLGPHEDYQFRIRGESRDFGYTEPSPSLPLYRRPILPNVPITRPVIEDVDSTSVRLGWQKVHIPSFGADDSPLTFMIEGQESPGSDWLPIARDIPDTRYVVRDLKPRQDYSFRIRGIRGPEISDPTPPLPVFRSPLQANWRPIREDFSRPSRPYFECLSIKVPPSMPIEKPILTDITGDSVGLSWRPARVPPNSSPPSYNVEIRKLPNMNWQRLAGGLTMTTYKATNLSKDRSYMFRIKAENEYGTSGSTMPASLGRPGVDMRKTYADDDDDQDQGFGQRATPRLPMDKPSVFEERPDVFVVSWAPARIPAYSRPSKIRYIIEKREPPSHDWTRVVSNISDTRHVVKGLRPDKDVMFRVRAESDFGVSDPTLAASVNRRPVITIPPRTTDLEEESLMLAPSTFISGTVGTATAPRAPTGRPVISEVKDSTLELSWLPARVPAYMKQTPVTYAVEIREPPSTSWNPLVSGLKETGHTVQDLKPKKDYMFRVRAENEHGTSEPTLPAILEREPEPKPEVERRMTPRSTPQRTLPRRRTPSMERDTTPLRFSSREATPLRYTSREPTPLRKGSISGLPVPAELIAPFDSDIQYGVEGRQAQICLGLRGFPLPTIQWFYKGKPLENDDKYNAFISPGGEATLSINDVCLGDIGEYKCNAENDQGVAVKIVQLDVADPPTFIEPLKDITIIAKNSGVLECRVDGIPYPEVKWNKDWRPLVETSRVFMDHESPDYWNLSLSSALKTDGGLYACIAENVAGKVHCVANVIVEDQAPSMTSLQYKQANIEDHYHILEEKGRGRSSIVRRVIEKSTGKEFAAKFIQVRDPADKELFKHELECLRLASHKNITGVQDAYETERRLVLVNELVSGPELLEKVVSESAWTESDAAYFIKQLLDLLQHLHSEGVVVVDLKPWDILLSNPGSDEVKLVDLGFARRLAASRDVRTSYGTAEFVAPEVVAGEPLSPSADVWSVGVIAYILLSGISPFFNESDRATLLTVQGADWDFDAKAFENISKEARDFIGKVLLKEAGERLTLVECQNHPWIKNAIKRGQGLKINISNHQALTDRYRTLRASTVVKTVADVRPLGKQLGATLDDSGLQPEVDPTTGETVYPDSQAYGEYLDEETWLDWQTRYQQGPGTQLLPLKETDLPLRIREYRRQKGEERAARSPSVESEMGEDRKMMKQRLLVSDVEAEFEPSPRCRKEFEWIVQPEEVKEARRRTSSESESQPQKTVGVRTDEEKSSFHPGLHHHHTREGVKGFSPVFLEKLKDSAYLVGDEVTFSCHVMASPTPSITWYRNEGMLSDGHRIRTSFTEDGRASITVLNTMPNDVGVYKCIVRNKLGTVTSRARLLLGDNPERPGRPVVCAVSSDEALLIWDAPKYDGNSFITNYRVDYRKAGEDRWTTSAHALDECALVQELKPSTIYRFRVSCSNRFGVSPFSWSSVEVRTKPPGAPKVSIDEELERLLLRSRQALECPTPRESAVRNASVELATIEEEMKTSSPEEDYSIGADIRKGGFSSIKCVSRKVGGEEYVAKATPGDSTKKDELIREFAVLRPLQHENVVRLISGYQSPQQVCLIMERLYGDNVVQHLSFKNTYTEESVATIMRQVLDAVQYLHHCGVAHLNLQPSSVMLASRRRLDVKLVDFSLARSITYPEGSHMPKMGFPDFLSPEMVAQEKVGFAADVWTIGALTFLLLSGESPFLGDTDLETFANIAYTRYDAQDLYENVTKEGLKFIYDVLKRLPRNRLGVEECLEHKWLQLTPNMVKARQEAVFLSNKLRRYAKDYHKKRLERPGVFILSSTPPPLSIKPKPAEVSPKPKPEPKTEAKETKVEQPKEEPEPKQEKPLTPEPKLETVKPKTPSPEPKPKTPSPEPKPKTPSPELVVDDKSQESVESGAPIIEEPSPKDLSPESPADRNIDSAVAIEEVENLDEQTSSELAPSSLYITEEPVSPMPGATPERETVEETIESIVELSDEASVSQPTGSVEIASGSQVEVSESSSTSQTVEVSSVTESQQSSAVEVTEEVSVQFSTSSETVEEVVSLDEESQDLAPAEVSESPADVTVTLSSDVSDVNVSEQGDDSLDVTNEVAVTLDVSDSVDASETPAEATADISSEVHITTVVDDKVGEDVAEDIDITLTDITLQTADASVTDVDNEVTFTVDNLDSIETSQSVAEAEDVTLATLTDNVETSVTVDTDIDVTLTHGAADEDSSADTESSVQISLPRDKSENTVSVEAVETETAVSFTVSSTPAETGHSTEETVKRDETALEETKEVSTTETIITSEQTAGSASETIVQNTTSLAVEEDHGSVDISNQSSQLTTTSEAISGETTSALSIAEATSSTTEEVDIFGEDDDYFAKRSQRSTRAVEVIATEENVVAEEEDDESTRRSSRRSRRSARSYEISGSEDAEDGYSEGYVSSRRSRRSERSYGSEGSSDMSLSEDYVSSRRARRSERSYEVSEQSSSSRESRRSGWRSRLGDL